MDKEKFFLISIVRKIARNVYNESNFLISRDSYEGLDQNRIVTLLLGLEEIENVVPDDEGLQVFIS